MAHDRTFPRIMRHDEAYQRMAPEQRAIFADLSEADRAAYLLQHPEISQPTPTDTNTTPDITRPPPTSPGFTF